MRIEASDFLVELVVKDAKGTELGMVAVPASELIETFIKIDADAAAAKDMKRSKGFNRLKAFREWLGQKQMPVDKISEELIGALMVQTYGQIETIQKKMLEMGPGKQN